ncbi:MAG: leucine-rich repeat protein, partial [Bacteroidaceae bacterium]|nr:leucine-rich repeat protein [Bacteroidaceae bacterium]
MKKFYFSLLAMMFIAAFSNTISAAEDFWYNGIAYKILNEALHTVEATTPSSGYTELGGPITIPANVYNNNKTYVVTQIGANAFQNCKAITSVTFAKTLITINLRAFYGCENL